MVDTNNGNAYAYGQQSPDCGATEQQQFLASLGLIFGELLDRDCANEQAIAALDSELTQDLSELETRLTDLIETAVDSETFVEQVGRLQQLLNAFNLDADSDGRLDFLQPTLDRVEQLVRDVADLRGFRQELTSEVARVRQIAENAQNVANGTAQQVIGLSSAVTGLSTTVANLPSLSQIRSELEDRDCSLKAQFWGGLATGLDALLAQVRSYQCQPSQSNENENEPVVPPAPTI
jgi:uncharacterized phage infection (PIP) family protein YhgE